MRVGSLKRVLVRWRFEEFGEVGSTQNEATRRAIEGAAEGTVIVARAQTAGRARFERNWESPEGGLYMSVILRPTTEGAKLLSLAGALAVLDGIADETRLSPLIRWPNDVVLDGKKVGGVIAEANFFGGSLSFVAVGIGVNCNFPGSSLGEFAGTSTTLKDVLRKNVSMVSLRMRTLQSLGRSCELLAEGQNHEVARRVRGVLSTVGKSVRYETVGGRSGVGVAEELTDDGSLRVVGGGHKYHLRAETIKWLREDD